MIICSYTVILLQVNNNKNNNTSKISREKTWAWLRKENHQRETKSHLITVQNNAIIIKAKIDKTQQNS